LDSTAVCQVLSSVCYHRHRGRSATTAALTKHRESILRRQQTNSFDINRVDCITMLVLFVVCVSVNIWMWNYSPSFCSKGHVNIFFICVCVVCSFIRDHVKNRRRNVSFRGVTVQHYRIAHEIQTQGSTLVEAAEGFQCVQEIPIDLFKTRPHQHRKSYRYISNWTNLQNDIKKWQAHYREQHAQAIILVLLRSKKQIGEVPSRETMVDPVLEVVVQPAKTRNNHTEPEEHFKKIMGKATSDRATIRSKKQNGEVPSGETLVDPVLEVVVQPAMTRDNHTEPKEHVKKFMGEATSDQTTALRRSARIAAKQLQQYYCLSFFACRI
jgi:hypothetical protein